jgi:acetoin utilization deacetylase AcuC-like enzyme
MRCSFHDDYVVDLPPGHAFPMRKFVLLRDILLREGLTRPHDLVAPPEAEWDLLALAHSREYLDALCDGTLDAAAVRRLGLPWSPALVRRSRRATMGTLLAARHALREGMAANLAGGTHHACHGHGEGYCVINDVVVAIRALRADGGPRRALVVDLDVHHGNGTAELLAGDAEAFTFSMHGANNFPLRKPPSSLDVALPDRTGDDEYLRALEAHLPTVLDRAAPGIAFYLAGVDVVAGDRFGRLSMTRAGLRARDRLVLRSLGERGIPAVLLLSGGYAATPELTADLHAETHRAAAEPEVIALRARCGTASGDG